MVRGKAGRGIYSGHAEVGMASILSLGSVGSNRIGRPIDFPYLDRVVEAALTRGGRRNFAD
jgi:hypothetical protein